MKICHIATFSQKSGVGIYALNLLKEMPKDIVVFDWPYKTKSSRLFGPLTSFFRLRKICRDCDIIHIQYHLWEYGPLFLPVLWLLKGKARIILTLHEMHEGRGWVKSFHNLFYRAADLLITHTKYHKQSLPEKLQSRIKVIPMGIKKVDSSIIKSDKIEILMPGFINKWKNHITAIKAVKSIVNNNLHLTIAGKSNDDFLLSEIKELCGHSIWATIKEGFLNSEDYDRLFRQADIILLPYKRITMSAILTDAIAYHKPVIASDIPSFRESLSGKCPLVNPDDVQDMTDKIDALVKDESARKDISDKFAIMAQLNSFKNLSRRLLKEYDLVLQSNKSEKR